MNWVTLNVWSCIRGGWNSFVLVLMFIPVINLSAASLHEEVTQSLEEIEPVFAKHPEQSLELLDSLLYVTIAGNNELAKSQVHLFRGNYFKVNSRFQLAVQEYEQAITLANRYNDHHILAEAYRELGAQMNRLGKNMEALKNFYLAIESAQKVDNFRLMGATYSLIGNKFRVLGDYYKAIEFIQLAEQNYKKADFEEGFAWIAYTLGGVYLDLGLYEDALNSFNQSLSSYRLLAAESGNNVGVAICLDRIGLAHYELNDLITARDNLIKAMDIYIGTQNIRGQSITLKNLAKVEYKLKNYDKSLDFLNQAYRLNMTENSIYGMATIYQYMGLNLFEKNQKSAAIDSVEIGLQYARSTKQRPLERNLYGTLAEMYYKTGRTETAFDYFQKQSVLSDSLTVKSAALKLAGLKNIYEMESRRQQIDELEIENQLSALALQKQRSIQLFLTIGGLFLGAFAIGLGYLFLSKRKTLLLVEDQRQELEKLVATKDRFFSIIAHDLRGPLAIIMQTLDAFLEMFPEMTRDEIFEMIKSMEGTSRRTFNLLENLLLWSRYQSGTLEANPRQVDIVEQVKSAMLMHQARAVKKKITLEQDIPTNLTAFVDPDMLATILRNLTSNAIKFTPHGGTVKIQAIRSDKQVQIDVIDTGIGIPKIKVEGLFQIEQKFNRRGTDGEESSGLGLILVNEFVEASGGSIRVRSVENESTTFSFTLNDLY